MRKAIALSLATLLTCGAVQAQDAFKHLGMSVEAGTTGLGVNLSYPVVTNHLILSVGYNFPSFSINKSVDLNPSYVNGRVDMVNSMIKEFNTGVEKNNANVKNMETLGLQCATMTPLAAIDKLESMQGDIEAKVNFGNWKVMLEFYPTLKSYFHITAGVMIGNEEWMTVTGTVDPTTWGIYRQCLAASDHALSTVEQYKGSLDANNAKIDSYNEQIIQYNAQVDEYNKAVDEYNKLPGVDPKEKKEKLGKISHLPDITLRDAIDDAAAVTVGDHTYVLDRNSNGRIDVAMKIKKVKPYIGVGFGSSVPTKHRMGFQMEIGAYYQGKPIIESLQQNDGFTGSTYSDKMLNEIVNTITRFEWYPQFTMRWTGRLF